LTIDCPDPQVAADFWRPFLGYQQRPAAADGQYVVLDRPEGTAGPVSVAFQRVAEPKTVKARAHLDLFVDHAEPVVTAMLAAGATRLSVTPAGEWTTRVLQDPAGNEYCVIGPD
jgi:hypothetical protein